MDKEKFELEILKLIRTYKLILEECQIEKLCIKSDAYSNTEIFYNNEEKGIILEDKIKFNFCKDLLKILLRYEFIGRQSHIKKINLTLSGDEMPIIKLEEYGLIIEKTIFDE